MKNPRFVHPWSAAAGSLRPCSAYTLIEVMIAMTLMGVIVVGLLASLNQSQKALKLAGGQTDTMETARAFMGLLSREMKEMSALPPEAYNTWFFASTYRNSGDPLFLDIPAISGRRTNMLSSFGFVTRNKELNEWKLVMYDVKRAEFRDRLVSGVYRAETNFSLWSLTNDLAQLQRRFLDWNLSAEVNTNFFFKVIDGVVDLKFHAYDTNGTRIPDWSIGGNTAPVGYTFTNVAGPFRPPNQLVSYRPSSLEVELGILDPEVREKVRSMNNSSVARQYLQERVGNVQVFRQRITVPTGP